jgi:hypothetical protein
MPVDHSIAQFVVNWFRPLLIRMNASVCRLVLLREHERTPLMSTKTTKSVTADGVQGLDPMSRRQRTGLLACCWQRRSSDPACHQRCGYLTRCSAVMMSETSVRLV